MRLSVQFQNSPIKYLVLVPPLHSQLHTSAKIAIRAKPRGSRSVRWGSSQWWNDGAAASGVASEQQHGGLVWRRNEAEMGLKFWVSLFCAWRS